MYVYSYRNPLLTRNIYFPNPQWRIFLILVIAVTNKKEILCDVYWGFWNISII